MTEELQNDYLEGEGLLNTGLSDVLHTASMRAPFSEVNALSITQAPIPETWVKTRRSGSTDLSYVSGDTVTRILNKAFRNRWSFEVKESRAVTATARNGNTQGIIQVLGRMTVPGWGVREQWGSQPLVGGADVQEHAYKAAATDAMKKCASMFGIALDLYGMAGAEHLMITPQDFLQDDEKVFENLREKIRLAHEQRQNQPSPEPEPEELQEMADQEEVETALSEVPDTPPAPADPSIEVMSDVAMVQGVEAPVEAATPAAEAAPARSLVWQSEDIQAMKAIMDKMGMQRNAELNPYVQQFMRSDEATIQHHITPVNVKDFVVFMENIIRSQATPEA